MRRILMTALLAMALATGASAQDWSEEQQQLIDSLERFSAAARPGGGGPEAYAAVLAPGFTRWTMGDGPIKDRETWIEGMRSWWNDGWRVVDSKADIREITIHGDFATTRRIVAETYQGPKGEESRSRSALAETWIRKGDDWLLLRVNLTVLEQR